MVDVIVTVSEQEKTDLESLARALGFSSVAQYFSAVLKAHWLRERGETDLAAHTADVLLVLPEIDRRAVQARMAALAEQEYLNNPDLIAFDTEDEFYDYPD